LLLKTSVDKLSPQAIKYTMAGFQG
jgi:hypothetical protein